LTCKLRRCMRGGACISAALQGRSRSRQPLPRRTPTPTPKSALFPRRAAVIILAFLTPRTRLTPEAFAAPLGTRYAAAGAASACCRRRRRRRLPMWNLCVCAGVALSLAVEQDSRFSGGASAS
jgi:hypothetical protein